MGRKPLNKAGVPRQLSLPGFISRDPVSMSASEDSPFGGERDWELLPYRFSPPEDTPTFDRLTPFERWMIFGD